MKILEINLTRKANIRTKSYAKYYCEINSIQDIEFILEFSKKENLEIQILGDGTNILFSKEYYHNVIFIKLKDSFNYFRITDKTVEIGASHSLMKAGKLLSKNGYENFIYMSLIPGSLGGAVRQNAGTTKEGEIKDSFISCIVYDLKEKKEKELLIEDMKFSYRNSIIQQEKNRYLVLSAKFKLENKTTNLIELKEFIKTKQKAKINKEPKGYTFGSTFKSHLQEKPAWWYIDQVGLKNSIIGGAKISEIHANWIVNYNNASASDIIELIKKIKSKVKKNFDIELIEEVEII